MSDVPYFALGRLFSGSNQGGQHRQHGGQTGGQHGGQSGGQEGHSDYLHTPFASTSLRGRHSKEPKHSGAGVGHDDIKVCCSV